MSQSTRRNFLKMVPIAALAPVAAEAVQDGVERVKLEPGHYVICVDVDRVDIEALLSWPGLLPENSKGGYVIPICGDVEGAIKFFKIEE